MTDRVRAARQVSLRRALAVMCAALLVVAVASIGYTAWVDRQRERAERAARVELQRQEREADRRWCAVLVPLNQAYASAAPTSEVGRQVAAAIRSIVLEFGCPPA